MTRYIRLTAIWRLWTGLESFGRHRSDIENDAIPSYYYIFQIQETLH